MSSKYAKDNPRTRAFLDAIVALSREHGLSLSHEDGHGAFMVEPFDERNADWLMAAFDETDGGAR